MPASTTKGCRIFCTSCSEGFEEKAPHTIIPSHKPGTIFDDDERECPSWELNCAAAYAVFWALVVLASASLPFKRIFGPALTQIRVLKRVVRHRGYKFYVQPRFAKILLSAIRNALFAKASGRFQREGVVHQISQASHCTHIFSMPFSTQMNYVCQREDDNDTQDSDEWFIHVTFSRCRDDPFESLEFLPIEIEGTKRGVRARQIVSRTAQLPMDQDIYTSHLLRTSFASYPVEGVSDASCHARARICCIFIPTAMAKSANECDLRMVPT